MRNIGTSWIYALSIVALGLMCGLAQPAQALTKCSLRFSLSGWSAFYQTAHGHGTVTCDNGQSARVAISSKGGGLTVGKSEIANGSGTFSEVSDIKDLFGAYAAANAEAGAVDASEAQALTKGPVSLALKGTGKGWTIGVAFSKFTISRVKK